MNGNRTVEADETFTVNLSNATGTNVAIARPTGTGTIRNDDATVLSINDVAQVQGPGHDGVQLHGEPVQPE